MATGLEGRRGRWEPGRVGWPAGPGLWSESASLGSDWLPASRDLAVLLWWTRQEGLERPKELCKPLPENKISEGRADPPEALLRGSPSQGANHASCRQQRLPKRQVVSLGASL